jgi:hypothetical protein
MTTPLALVLLVLAAGPQDATRETLGQARCAQCHDHQDENRWWLKDRHRAAADPLISRDSSYLRVADRYRITTERALASDGPCAVCHATVPAGAGSRPISEGVSCERCHGPASAWLEVHDDDDPIFGRDRKGFVEALKLGLRDLENLDVRANVCMSCHYITEGKLVAAGHTSGKDFDYARGMSKIRHWKDRVPVTDEAILRAVGKRRAERGPLPPQLLPSLDTTVVIDPLSGFSIPRRVQNQIVAKTPSASPIPTLTLPPFPTVTREMTIEQRLALLSGRLREVAALSASP